MVRQPGRDLAVTKTGGVELRLAGAQHRDADQVAQLELRIGRDVDTLDRERTVEADPPECAMRVLAEVAAGAFVERDGERRLAMGPQPHEGEATPEVPAEHG